MTNDIKYVLTEALIFFCRLYKLSNTNNINRIIEIVVKPKISVINKVKNIIIP